MGSIDSSTANGVPEIEAEAIVVGAGFGGMYSMYKFRKMGINVQMIEAGSDYGGTWHWNRYPGARVDSETPYYQLSIPEVWKTWTFSERFPDHVELRRYFNHVDKVLSLRKDTHFNTIVSQCNYDTSKGEWTLKLHPSGGVARCKYLILATGSSYKKHYPDFKDMSMYKGTLVHSAIFPEAGLDVKGKKVAIIGNGATGVQILQEIAKEDCQLTAYIRTPNIALPMMQRKMSAAEQDSYKSFYVNCFQNAKQCRSGFPVNTSDASVFDVTPEEREAQFEWLWSRGGFAFLLSNYRDFLTDKKANKLFYDFWAEKTRKRMKNETKRDIVAPVEQPHFFGTKRPCLEQDYYETLDRDNVEIVNMKTHGLERFTEKGIISADGKEREFDTVILATGYDSLTGSLYDLNLHDTKNRPLSEKWEKGVYTYLGLMIDGMPNAFMVYSPQAPTSLANGPPIIEIQVDWIAECVRKMKAEGIDSVNPKWEDSDKWRQDIQDMNENTLFPLTDSW